MKKWRWKSVMLPDISAMESSSLSQILASRNIALTHDSDKLIWAGSKKGRYESKEGYKHILNKKHTPCSNLPLSLCWDKRCLPKAGLFAWLAIQNRILTSETFKKFGYEGPSRCPLCEKAEESSNHLLVTCDYAHNCWGWLRKQLIWYFPIPNSILDLFYA